MISSLLTLMLVGAVLELATAIVEGIIAWAIVAVLTRRWK